MREELNVRQVRFVAAAEELSEYEVKANYRTLGPLFGKDMPGAAEAIAALDPARVAAAIRDGKGEVGIAVNGREHTLSADDVILTMRAPRAIRSSVRARMRSRSIWSSTRPCAARPRARDRACGAERAQDGGPAVEDRIELSLTGARGLIEAAESHRDYPRGETLAAVALSLERRRGRRSDGASADGYNEQTEVDGLQLTIALRRAGDTC